MMMFTKLHIHNYKAIGPEPLDLDLAPITILVGKSGSGKSCVLEALALTAQSAVEDPQRHDLILSGNRLKLPTEGFQDYREPFRFIYHALNPDRPMSVGFTWTTVGPEEPEKSLEYTWSRKGLEWAKLDHYLAADGAPILRFWSDISSEGGRSRSVKYSLELHGEKIPDSLVRSTGVDRVLSDTMLELTRLPKREAKNHGEEVVRIVDAAVARSIEREVESALSELKNALEGVQFLSSLRGEGLMQMDAGPKNVRFVGLHGENTARLLASIHARTGKGYKALKPWAKKFGLPEIETGPDGSQLKVVFVDRHTGSSLELWQAATGSKQGLMLAAQLLLSPSKSTLLIEEPEANMHPGYEKLLPGLFAESAKGGRQVLATTHSEVLVAAMGNAVRKGDLEPSDIAIYHLERDGQGVKAERLDFSKKGNLAAWVKSFAEVEKSLFDEWYDELPE
jgi:ABC-type ATPase involved in cell division